jgi:glycosyltransferase involved in cell wall biosynthesis
MASNGMLYPLFRRLKDQPGHPLLVSHVFGLSLFDHQAMLNETMRGHMSLPWMFRNVTGDLPVKWDFYGSQHADLTIVLNDRDRDLLTEKGFSPLVSIPLAVHPKILAASVSAPPPEQREPHRLLWFGSWVERKGCHYLPSAFKQIVERYPDARLSIGGTGLSAEAVMSHFDYELRSRLTVLPYMPIADQIEEYGRHAIFLFPSLSEGFGFALLEAMSMGLAVVTTDTGFAGDWLSDHQDAMIVPAASALHLARGTMKLIEDNELRHHVARKGQETSRLFTLDRMIDAYETVFEKYRWTSQS